MFPERLQPSFRRTPQNPADAHRPVLHDPQELGLIFSLHAHRKLSKNFALQYKNREYQLTGQSKDYRLRDAKVTVCETFDGLTTLLLYKGRVLPYRILSEGEPLIPRMTRKASTPPSNRPRLSNSTAAPTSLRLTIPGSRVKLSHPSLNLTTKRDISDWEKKGHLRIGLTPISLSKSRGH